MIDKVHSVMQDKQRLTIKQLSKELELSFGSGESIMTEDLGMKHISMKFVPKLLTVEQKETRLAVARDLL
jgi:acyl CoA:acetate/3-ketoacid CoA transferase alpha subunit